MDNEHNEHEDTLGGLIAASTKKPREWRLGCPVCVAESTTLYEGACQCSQCGRSFALRDLVRLGDNDEARP